MNETCISINASVDYACVKDKCASRISSLFEKFVKKNKGRRNIYCLALWIVCNYRDYTINAEVKSFLSDLAQMGLIDGKKDVDQIRREMSRRKGLLGVKEYCWESWFEKIHDEQESKEVKEMKEICQHMDKFINHLSEMHS